MQSNRREMGHRQRRGEGKERGERVLFPFMAHSHSSQDCVGLKLHLIVGLDSSTWAITCCLDMCVCVPMVLEGKCMVQESNWHCDMECQHPKWPCNLLCHTPTHEKYFRLYFVHARNLLPFKNVLIGRIFLCF